MAELSVGDKAPGFSLPGDGGKAISLDAYKGRPVVVYFYPKDDTSGCTKEAINFTELMPEFEAAGVAVIGISPDPVASHDKFKAKHDLKIELAADEDRTAIETYGVWVEKSMYGKKYMGVDRSTFLIGPDGRIAEAWRKVKVPGHAEAVLAAATALGGAETVAPAAPAAEAPAARKPAAKKPAAAKPAAAKGAKAKA